jgi:hypothetical protein
LPPPFADVIGVTIPFFVLVSAMEVISLVAIPLRENVPIFSIKLDCKSLDFGWKFGLDSSPFQASLQGLQVIEIPNT